MTVTVEHYKNRALLIMEPYVTARSSTHKASFEYNTGSDPMASQVAPVLKNLPVDAGIVRNVGSIPGLGRSPEEGTATHSSILAWRIPWTEEPGSLLSKGCTESDMTEVT